VQLRRRILAELMKFNDAHPQPDAWLDPTSLPLWNDALKTKGGNLPLGNILTQLLQEELVMGRSSVTDKNETLLVVRLNPNKLAEVKSELDWDRKY